MAPLLREFEEAEKGEVEGRNDMTRGAEGSLGIK